MSDAASRSPSTACASPTGRWRRSGGSTSRSRAARCSRCSARTAPERRRRWRSSRDSARATPARSPCSGTTPAARRPRHEGARRHRPAVHRHRPLPDGGRDGRRCTPATTRSPRPVDEVIERRRADGEGRHARDQALGRAAAAAGRGHRAGRRPGAAVPRRADHRVRPVGAARGLGGGQEPGVARQDGPADDALHGRGAVPGRPRGGHRGRAHRRRGPPRPSLARPGDGQARIRFRAARAASAPAADRRRRADRRGRDRRAGRDRSAPRRCTS